MQATEVLLGAMIQHGHTPRIIHLGGGYIQAECVKCGLDGGVHADAAGEYVEDSAQGSAFAVECPEQGSRPG
jgi:hypothetical protein